MAQPKPSTPSSKKTVAAPVKGKAKINFFLLLGILALTLIIYWPSLPNQLTNWDDQEYITLNQNLKEASLEKHFVEHPRHMGNYHPFTMVSLAWDYSAAVDETTGTINPVPFHRTNLFLHVLNAWLVYLLIFRLSKNNGVAAFTAAIFALHPMHVESVAWASERKDVLYTCFYLLALWVWTYYAEGKNKVINFVIVIVAFLLSLWSKGVAVTLPLVFLPIDYYVGRKWNWMLIIEKLPFFVLSVVFGLIAVDAQKEFESLSGNETYALWERGLFASYGTMQYMVKFFVPGNLSCFYALPAPGHLNIWYYLSPVFVLGLLYLVYRFRKNKTVVFGFMFFFITVVLVLQLISVGGAVMADRYTYLPYIGLAFILGTLAADVEKKKRVHPQLALFVPCAFVLLMAVFAYQRTQVWQNSVVLWADAESKDKGSPKIYSNFGDACTLAGDYNRAIQMLNRALELKPDYPDAYYNRGLALYYQKRYEEAITDYTSAIQYNPHLKQAWYNRAGTYFTIGKPKEALADAKKAYELGYPVDPMFFKALEQAIQQQAK